MYAKNSRNSVNPEQKEWILEYRTLMRKNQDTQKTSYKYLNNLVNLGFNNKEKDIAQHLAADYEQIDNHTNKQQSMITTKINKIFKGLKDFKQILKSFQHTETYLMKIQKVSTNVYEKLQMLKSQMVERYDELDQGHQRYEKQVQLAEKRVEAVGHGNQNLQTKNKQQRNIMNQNKNKNKDGNSAKVQVLKQQEQQIEPAARLEKMMLQKQNQVERVDQDIREMGKNLGWCEQDHKDFITMWNRCNNKNYFQIEQQLTSYFNFYTGQQIREHMNKYLKYKKLIEHKKKLINDYKGLKEQKKQLQLIKLQQKQLQRQAFHKKSQYLLKKQKQQQQMKQKVEEWKKKKQKQKIEQIQREKIIKEERRRQQELRKREELDKRKQILEKWKQDKQKQKQTNIKSSRKRPSSAISKQAAERIKEREQKMRQQQMQRLIQKKMQQQENLKKQQKIKQGKMLKYAHINSKLEQKTTAIKQKQRNKFDGKQKKEANTFGGQLLLTGIRAVPEWRQGI